MDEVAALLGIGPLGDDHRGRRHAAVPPVDDQVHLVGGDAGVALAKASNQVVTGALYRLSTEVKVALHPEVSVIAFCRAGEQVVVDGFQKLRPCASVKAVPWTPPAAACTRPRAPPREA